MDSKKFKQLSNPGEAGEDGDFVQLRIVRERKLARQAQKANTREDSIVVSKSGAISEEKHVTYEVRQEPRPSTALLKKTDDALREQLFKAVDTADKTEILNLIAKTNNRSHVSTFRDPDTNENVLHYAISSDKKEMARFLIENGDEKLLLSDHDVQRSGIHGKSNSLHLYTEKNDKEMVIFLLNKINPKKKIEFMKLETAVDITGQRPRLFSCLHLAAFYGHTDLVRIYLDLGIDVNHLNGKKDTALLWAARWGHDETVKLLLDRGADTEVLNDKGSTALYWAIRYDFPKTVSILLNKGKANPNTKRKLGLVAPIVLASAYGNTEIVSLLVQHPEIDLHVRIRGGEMAIHHAAKEGNLEVLEMLIKRGASPNEQDELGDTPFLLAAKNGHVDIVLELLRKGININHRNHEGHDAWYYAIENEDNELMHALVTASRGGETSWRHPLCIAASSGRCDKLQVLLKMNLDPSSADLDGNTFLHHAAMNNKFEVIEKFHTTLSVNTQNKKGNTPLHIACFRGFSETIDSLIKCKAKADVKNLKGETALHVAGFSKHITADAVKQLVEYTIKTHAWESLNAKDFEGNNCLHIAGKHAKPEVLWEFRFVRFKDRDKDGLIPLHEAVRPNEPEALDTMLDIFESNKRDARINEQSYATHETVLHLAAMEGHSSCVRRLIELGADIAVKDVEGDTVLHQLVKASVNDSKNLTRYLEVFDTIFENIVKWWCIKKSINFPEEENRDVFMAQHRDASLFVINDICNNDGLSVLEQAFKSGSPDILSRILMMPGVTMFEGNEESNYSFDISGLTPITNNAVQGCCGKTKRVEPLQESDIERYKLESEAELRLSGLEWLISHTTKARASEIMDIPPIRMIEKYYRSIVGWTFALLMLSHIIYMSVFTYIAVDILEKLREDETKISESDPQTLLLYIFVPIEPLIILMYVLYTLIRYIIQGDVGKKSKLSRKKGLMRVISVVGSYMFILVCVIFAGLVFTWIGLFTVRYEYQDYFLAMAICIGWLITIAFTRGIRLIHYFYRMLISMIIRDVVRFIIVYLFVLLGFGFAFHLLFQVSGDVVSDYTTPGDTLFLTFNMMIGMGELFDGTFESNLANAGRTSTYVKMFYLVYIILSTIVLLNLLIAMMNDSYAMILKENQATWRIESINLGVEIETNFPATAAFANVKLNYGLLGQSMNDTVTSRWYVDMTESTFNEFMHEIDQKYTTTTDAVSKRLEDLEAKTALMEKQLISRLDHLSELLEQRANKRKTSAKPNER